MALGAFLGGLVLAESEYSHQAYAEIRPLRDILAGLFFISLGMLVDPSVLLRQFPLIVGIAVLLVVVKATVATGAFLAAATTMRVAATAGIDLAQVGEFSFILGRSGLDVGLLTASQWQLLLAASIATMVVTPALLGACSRGRIVAGDQDQDRRRPMRPTTESATSRITSSSSASAWAGSCSAERCGSWRRPTSSST